MSAFKCIAARFYRDDRGASMVEYAILIGLITVAAIIMIGNVSDDIVGAWTAVHNAFNPA